MNYEQVVKERMIPKYPKEQMGGKFRRKDTGYPHIFRRLEDNFINGKFPIMKRLKGTLPDGKIHYNCANHLNSSQAMCIAYFKKFFEDRSYEPFLTKILLLLGMDITGTTFTDAIFEYEPDPAERTNFDFYLGLSDGRQISWEVKFTEKEFGGTTKKKGDERRYIDKWEKIYMPMLERCVYGGPVSVDCEDLHCLAGGKLTDDCDLCGQCPVYEFYKYYQIRRNIVYAAQDGDYVLFLTPRENPDLDDGRAYIERYAKEYNTDCIRNIYWEDLLNVTLQVVSCNADLLEYYKAFRYKYFESSV